ncbi:hypothetical protein [Nostoc sp.]|uniref:hypothetical protein n=1 Tax=Nostoc sp. TaxID=1180 RepID=UPI002FF93084
MNLYYTAIAASPSIITDQGLCSVEELTSPANYKSMRERLNYQRNGATPNSPS